MLAGGSFINIRKRTGPNTVPCRTPEVTGTFDEVAYTLSSVGRKRQNPSVNVFPYSIQIKFV